MEKVVTDSKKAMAIIGREQVRALDGHYSDGHISVALLVDLASRGKIETYTDGGHLFVRAKVIQCECEKK